MLEGRFQFHQRHVPLIFVLNATFIVENKCPGFVEPFWNLIDPPFFDRLGEDRFAQIVLNLRGIVVILDVNEVRLTLMFVLEFFHGVDLGAAGWAGAERGSGEHYYRRQIAVDGIADR